MTYEERLQHRDLIERARALRERLGEGDSWAQVTREEALELTSMVEETLELLSPERFDRMMETIAHEASRRAGVMSAP